MDQIKVNINGKEIVTTAGRTIIDIVNEHKLDNIPTLCHDERIEPYGSCFLCVVEVEGLNKLVPSCSTLANNNMVIRTNSEKIIASRKTALELLLSNHYADCVGPCIGNCPASVDAQGYIALISMGKYEEALKLVKQSNPLPLSIGRVCVRNCEDACRRCLIDSPVSVNYMKRYIADIDNTQWKPQIKEKNNKKIAVIGGGPAGLTCTYYLLLQGYSVTIFEKLPELGGMLRYGIPEYRLPKKILDSEISWIVNLGAEVKTGVEMGKDYTIEYLKKQGFDAVFISVGAHKASNMKLDGEDTIKNIYSGIDFLREQEINGGIKLSGTVIVVGGGNTAIDAARTALRSGAEKVKIVYRRSINEMPAHPSEIEDAQHEGVEILFLTNPKSILSENDKIKAIECIKMKLEAGTPGERPKPVPVENSEYNIACDYLISAIGQQVDISFVKSEKDMKLEKWGTVIVNPDTFETSIPGAFSGGDVISGPLTAVNAIGHGKKAANAIDSYIKSGKATNGYKKFYSFKHNLSNVAESEYAHFNKITSSKMPVLSLDDRLVNFKEVELGFTKEQIENEFARCLECGCSEYFDCKLRQYADEFQVDISDFKGEVRKFKVDKTHPFISLDPNKCINCGKCVRTCTEILQVSALGFVNRGFKAVVKPAMEKPLLETNCIACGNCIDVCPTGAISEKFPFKVLGTLPKYNHETICNFCSIGCKLNFKIIDNDIFYVSNSIPEIIHSKNDGYLCVKGKFGNRYLTGKNKIESPFIRQNNNQSTTGIDKAIAYTSDKIKEIITKYGSESVAVFASPKLTNEELYLIQKFARTGLKTNQISSFTNLINEEYFERDSLMGLTCSAATIYDIENADIILAINADLSAENLVIELKIKQAQKRGAKLILISSLESRLVKFSDLWIDAKKGTSTILLSGLIREILKNDNRRELSGLKESIAPFDKEMVTELTGIDNEKLDSMLALLNKTEKNVLFVYNIDSLKDKSKNDLKALMNYLTITDRINKKGNGVIILRDYANSTGLLDMGISPNYLPGYVKYQEKNEIKKLGELWETDLSEFFKPASVQEQLLKGKIKAAIIIGEDPLFDRENQKYLNNIEFLAVMDTFHTETTGEANVVIPMGTYIEQYGTITSCDTHIQQITPITNNENQLQNWEIISRLADQFGMQWKYKSHDDIFREIKLANRLYNQCEADNYWNKGVDYQKLLSEQTTNYLSYEIDMSTYPAKKSPVLYCEGYYLKNIKNKLKI